MLRMGILRVYIKVSIIIALIVVVFSCATKKESMEIIQSNVMSNLYLIKNPPKRDSILKKDIIRFLIKNPPKKDANVVVSFYKYTEYDDFLGMRNGTSHFIDNLPDPGGFSSEELENYKEDKVASFVVSKCEKDTTKFIGEFFFYKDKYNREKDTLLYKCK